MTKEGILTKEARFQVERANMLMIFERLQNEPEKIQKLLVLEQDEEGRGRLFSYNYETIGEIIRHLAWHLLGEVADKDTELEKYNKYADLLEQFTIDFLSVKEWSKR